MARDTLSSILAVRKFALETERVALAHALAAEQDASAKLAEATNVLRQEAELASALDSTDAAVEAFGQWLPIGLAAERMAKSQVSEAERLTTVARTALAAAASAEAVIQALIDERKAQAYIDALRLEQLINDDLVASKRVSSAIRPRSTGRA